MATSMEIAKQRRRAELHDHLLESEERYRSITENASDAIITVSDKGRILSWNQAAQRIFGYGQEVVGRPVSILIPAKFKKAHKEGFERFLNTGESRLIGRTAAEFSALRADGEEFPIELSLSHWEGRNGLCFGAIIRDISKRKRLERIRLDVEQMVRHDMRSYLVGIAGFAGRLLKYKSLGDKQRQYAETIADLAERAVRVINRSRDIFQMEQGIYKLKPARVELYALLRRVIKKMDPMIKGKKLTTRLLLEGSAVKGRKQYRIMGEADILERLFINLIKNAVEASPAGGAVTIDVQEGQRQNYVFHRIDIHNQGVIPEKVREAFFQPYVTYGKKHGTGLGTHSALLAARTHQGDISFTTSGEGGTHLIVSLPKYHVE